MAPRTKIASMKRLRVGDIPVDTRAKLSDELYAIYSETSEGATPEQFRSVIFGEDERQLALLYGADGELAGFVDWTIDRVTHAKGTTAVFCPGAFMRRGYGAGMRIARLGFLEAVKFKLKEPLTPLAMASRASSPPMYRLSAKTLRTLYPRPNQPTPPWVEDMVRQIIAARGLTPVEGSLWRIRSIAVPKFPARAAIDHPDARFFLEMNPNYAEERTGLFIFAPLDVGNVVGSIVKMGWNAIRGRE